mmetsp:Transcript_20472/g.45149  ORF Transcript_20472/g.45149 Transcript_20472/m.45149 type:complete len:263 (+) Transcript_20472:934-1722(+)
MSGASVIGLAVLHERPSPAGRLPTCWWHGIDAAASHGRRRCRHSCRPPPPSHNNDSAPSPRRHSSRLLNLRRRAPAPGCGRRRRHRGPAPDIGGAAPGLWGPSARHGRPPARRRGCGGCRSTPRRAATAAEFGGRWRLDLLQHPLFSGITRSLCEGLRQLKHSPMRWNRSRSARNNNIHQELISCPLSKCLQDHLGVGNRPAVPLNPCEIDGISGQHAVVSGKSHLGLGRRIALNHLHLPLTSTSQLVVRPPQPIPIVRRFR